VRPLLVDWLAALAGRPAAEAIAPGYFTFAALGALLGAWLLVRRARREGEDAVLVIRALTWGYVATIAGGIAVPIAVELARQVLEGEPVRLRWAGMVAYYGIACGLGAAAWVARRGGIAPLRFADLAAAPIFATLAVVRLGCFVAGCDYGQVTSAAWAVRFPVGSPAWRDHVVAGLVPASRPSLPVHPTQLYEALLAVALFAGVTLLWRRRRRAGEIFLMAAPAYALGRAVIEGWRGDASRGLLWGVASTSQVLGAVVIVLCAAALLRRRAAVVAAITALLLAVAVPDAHAQEAEAPPDPAAPQAATKREIQKGYDVTLYLSAASALNRPQGQVPQLTGGSLLVTFTRTPPAGLGFQLESVSNAVASHVSLLGVVAFRTPMGKASTLDLRAALGFTGVNFDDDSFEDLVAGDFRLALAAEWRIADKVALVIQPLALDFTMASGLGGWIVSYQFGIGVSWGTRHAAPRPSPPAAAPATPPPDDTGPMK
jgi:prolipoprotein diacylglyceryltransferase